MQLEFTILDWVAYASGLTQRSEWVTWAQRPPQLPSADCSVPPALSEMPAMMRRRVDRLGRLACQVAYWCQPAAANVPMVFASRYGDAARSLALLGDLVQGVPLSPTGFGLSVHNAASALYTIARADTSNTVVVAAGAATVEAALVEAVALLADGAPEVLVVYYEAPLPGAYETFQDDDAREYAWAWRVAAAGSSAGGDGAVHVRVELGGPGNTPGSLAKPWPAGLSVLRHVVRQVVAATDPDLPLTRPLREAASATWIVHA